MFFPRLCTLFLSLPHLHNSYFHLYDDSKFDGSGPLPNTQILPGHLSLDTPQTSQLSHYLITSCPLDGKYPLSDQTQKCGFPLCLLFFSMTSSADLTFFHHRVLKQALSLGPISSSCIFLFLPPSFFFRHLYVLSSLLSKSLCKTSLPE